MDRRQIGSGYVAETLVGQGACGQVWAGRDTEGRPWAIKVLRSELAADPGLVTRFVSERTVLEAIRHPHVVSVHDLVVEGTTLAVVMPLIEGSDLRGELRARGSIEPAGVASWGAQLAGALQAAHRAGVVHRDVKPENVLVRESDEAAMLTDFGIARIIDGATHSTMMLGTPQYMAPEIAEGRAAGPEADLYSLGILLYELACGVTPFMGRGSAMATLRAHLSEVPGRPVGVPDELWTVIAMLVSKDPTRRGGTAGQVEARLAGMVGRLEGLPAAPRVAEPPPAERHVTWAPPLDASVAQQTSRWVGPARPGAPTGAPWRGTPGQGPPPYGAGPPGSRPVPQRGYAPGPQRGYAPGPPRGYPSAPARGYPSAPQGYLSAPPRGVAGGRVPPGYVAARPSRPAPPPPRNRMSPWLLGVGAAVLMAAGILGAMLAAGAWDDESAPSPPAASDSPSAPGGESATTPGVTEVTVRPQAATLDGAAANPPAATAQTTAATAGQNSGGSSSSQAPETPRTQVDVAARRASAESLLSQYLTHAESKTLTPELMVGYFVESVSWYDRGQKSREEILTISQGDPTKARSTFRTNRTESFDAATTYSGLEADVLTLHRTFTRPDGETGDFLVTYTHVYDRPGQAPRIAKVRETRL